MDKTNQCITTKGITGRLAQAKDTAAAGRSIATNVPATEQMAKAERATAVEYADKRITAAVIIPGRLAEAEGGTYADAATL